MEPVTIFSAVPFVADDDGNIFCGEPQEAQSASEAIGRARRMAATSAGAVAFSRAGDKATGDFKDGVLLASFGTVPNDLTEYLSG